MTNTIKQINDKVTHNSYNKTGHIKKKLNYITNNESRIETFN